MIYARVAVTGALLVLAGLLLIDAPNPGNVSLATTIIGLVVGYWLHVTETKAIPPAP